MPVVRLLHLIHLAESFGPSLRNSASSSKSSGRSISVILLPTHMSVCPLQYSKQGTHWPPFDGSPTYKGLHFSHCAPCDLN